ncbi:CheR family methyltransferase [Saltatorellus ferox]
MKLREFDSPADEVENPLPVVAIACADGHGAAIDGLMESIRRLGRAVVLVPSHLVAAEAQGDGTRHGQGEGPAEAWGESAREGSAVDPIDVAEDVPVPVGVDHLPVVDDRGTAGTYLVEPMVGSGPLALDEFARRVANVFGDRAVFIAWGSIHPTDLARIEEAAAHAAAFVRLQNDFSGEMDEAQARIVEKHLRRVRGAETSDFHAEIHALLPEFAEAALHHSTLDLRHYKHGTLVRRIAQRIGVVRAGSPTEYLKQLKASASESLALVQSVLIGVTSFFRDPEAFAALRRRIETRLIEDSAAGLTGTFRIWVPGCSTGEEAYSLAILTAELLRVLHSDRPFQVFATDLNAAALVKARRGDYAEGSLEPLDAALRDRYFDERGGQWRLKESLRERVLFSVHNLINDPPLNRMDLVSCRNLMIYLGPHLQKKLFPLFHFALAPGGTLFLGSSESLLEHKSLFDPVEERFNIAVRRDVAPQRLVHNQAASGPSLAKGRLPGDAEPRPIDLVDLMKGIVLDEFVPASIVIDGDGQIRAASPGMDPFLSVTAGEFRNNIFWLARPGLRPALRAAIGQATAHKRRVVVDRVWVQRDDAQQQMMITVQPMPSSGVGSGLFLVVFHEVGLPVEAHAPEEAASTDHALALEAELSKLRREYEDTVQRLEAANEELKSGNEELISINEELRSTNDELNASKEEVQRAHAQLARVHDEVENLLLNTEAATIFLDGENRILRYTPTATRIFNILPADVGRPLHHLTHLADQMPSMDAGEEHSNLRRITLKDGSVMQRRVRPLTASDGTKIGRVINFDDITTVDRARREEAARLSELRAVYASAGVGLALVTRDLVITSANRQFSSLLLAGKKNVSGKALGSAAGLELDYVLPPDMMEGIQSLVLALSSNEQTAFHVELRGRTHDGEWRSWRVSGRRTSAEPVASGFSLAVDDISERVEAENRALKSSAFLRSIVDAVEAFIGVCDSEGRLTECNRQLLEAIDATSDEVLGLPFEQTPWWSHDEATRMVVKELVQQALAGESVRRTLTYRNAGGEVRHLDFQASPMQGSSGANVQAVVSGFDTEERFQTSERLRLLNRQLEIALRSVEMGTWWWFLDSDELLFDAPERALWGLDATEEVTLKKVMALVHPDDVQGLDEALSTAIEAESTYEHSFRVLRPDGTLRRLGAQGETFIDEESKRRVLVGVNWDTTEEFERSQELEEARRQAEAANRAKSEFLANMSHEIRTPMTAILGYADILAKHLKDPDNTNLVETIRRNGRFLLEILNDILDLAKIESGMLPVQLVPTPPEQVVEEVASLMQVRAIEKGIDLKVEYDTQLPTAVECDPIRLRQVLLNLVGNAVKFTDRGGVAIRVTANSSSALFEVEDTGIGIDPMDIPTLFEPFTQVDNSSQRERGGTGLGLTISRRLCQAMSGDLTVNSQPGAGSKFTVSLPIKDYPPVPRTVLPVTPSTARASEPFSERAVLDRRVLVVDDRRDVRSLVQFLFEDAGAEVLLASHGKEAVERYEGSRRPGASPIDLIIMDMQMPVMDGYAAARHLRKIGCKLPIIAVTAHAMQGELEKCLEAGCTDYTTKPIDGDLLLRMASALLPDGPAGLGAEKDRELT